MEKKVKIYNQVFYDREPRYLHISPRHFERHVSNKQTQLLERRRQNIMDGIDKASVDLEYNISDTELWDEQMQHKMSTLI